MSIHVCTCSLHGLGQVEPGCWHCLHPVVFAPAMTHAMRCRSGCRCLRPILYSSSSNRSVQRTAARSSPDAITWHARPWWWWFALSERLPCGFWSPCLSSTRWRAHHPGLSGGHATKRRHCGESARPEALGEERLCQLAANVTAPVKLRAAVVI
jgi:hypothetical protein